VVHGSGAFLIIRGRWEVVSHVLEGASRRLWCSENAHDKLFYMNLVYLGLTRYTRISSLRASVCAGIAQGQSRSLKSFVSAVRFRLPAPVISSRSD
jgi:hypothetical protein